MDANEIKINQKRHLGNASISDFFKPKVSNTDGNNNASSSVISKYSEQGKGNDSNQCTLPPVVTTLDIQTSACFHNFSYPNFCICFHNSSYSNFCICFHNSRYPICITLYYISFSFCQIIMYDTVRS